MAWPLSQDYNEAVQDPGLCFADDELRAAQVVTNALGLPMPRSGNFADVYEMCSAAGDRRWAVKCFTRAVPGQRERYAAISDHLRQARLRFTVEFQYLEQGIRVAGQWYPVVKMDWVEGLLLNEFVRNSLDRPAMLEALANRWVKLARKLRSVGIAHADLQHGNVLLVPGRDEKHLALKLIDYDGMFVPALASVPSGEVGHPSYQHPKRLRDATYNAEVDCFPLLVISTAIRALMVGGRPLWDRYDNGDNLLFGRQDFAAPTKSMLIAELLKLGDPTLRLLAEQLIDAARRPLNQTPLLDDLIPRERESFTVSGNERWVSGAQEAPVEVVSPRPVAGPPAEPVVATLAAAAVPVGTPSRLPSPAVLTPPAKIAASPVAPERASGFGQSSVAVPRKKRGMPLWAWMVAGATGAAVAGGVSLVAVVWFAFVQGKPKQGSEAAPSSLRTGADMEHLTTKSARQDAAVGKKGLPVKEAVADDGKLMNDADTPMPPSVGPAADKAKAKPLIDEVVADKAKVKPLTEEAIAGNYKPRFFENGRRAVPAVPLVLLDERITLADRPAVHIWRKKGIDIPCVLSNSSDKTELVPGGLLPHKVSVHPSPNEFVAITWKSPIAGSVRVAAQVTRLRPDGNGVAWWIEYRRSGECFVLADGLLHPGGTATAQENVLNVEIGDLLMLAVDPRNGDHGADHTDISFTVTDLDNPARSWDLAADVADTLVAANPHADRQGSSGVWRFVRGPAEVRNDRGITNRVNPTK
jgi:hypothetical protein